ncbi:MAG: hypothetical protein HKN42_06445 [Granulosicoccus sp.]|nr:hypothetical protein [Granulosicoccus sp.]
MNKQGYVIRESVGVVTMRSRKSWVAIICVTSFLTVSGAVHAERLVSTTIENRVVLGFQVDDAALEQWLPDEWSPVTLSQGPVAGSNLLVALMDRLLILDAEGNPASDQANRAAAFVSYARKEGIPGVRAFITRVFETAPLTDPYGNSVTAQVAHTAESAGGIGENRVISESWVIRPDGGGELSFDLSYEPGNRVWTKGAETRPYSAVEPEFHRIYRYDQLSELAMSRQNGKMLAGSAEFESSIPEFQSLFDGSEVLAAVISIPVYVRDVYLP